MRGTWLTIGALGMIMAALLLVTLLALWRMFDFRARWHGLWVNSQWERSLDRDGHYADHSIVFFGDSQLALWRMAPAFGRLPIRNRGISGDQAVQAVNRFDRDVLAYEPDAVLFLIGTNDLAHQTPIDEVTAAIKQMIDAALGAGVHVLVGSVLPVAEKLGTVRAPDAIVELNRRLQEMTTKDGVSYVDFHRHLVDARGWMNDRYTDDGLHPNESGYAVMTQTVMPYLVQAIQWQADEE